ncbi:hypothetical protein [Bradyrhizobium genosp. P]|uniref:hypothetical protein n=1 Tax=Bradyrhizobium genosp. P TaxID=83641 RepID=UPI003CF41916
MRRSILIAVIAGLCLGGSIPLVYDGWRSVANDRKLATPHHPLWTEAEWPFPMDEWGKGKAFECAATDCGVGVKLYIRAKLGFCNCTTGVADDEELDRVADLRFIGEPRLASPAGSAITVGRMKGRSRVHTTARSRGSAVAIAFNDRCDVVVATALVAHPDATALEPTVIAFLNSETIVHWVEITLGL